ncbi:hypothetical protein [Corynebacterium pseudotuberculosis]
MNWIAAGAPPTTAHSDASGTITRDDRLVLIPQRLPPPARRSRFHRNRME